MAKLTGSTKAQKPAPDNDAANTNGKSSEDAIRAAFEIQPAANAPAERLVDATPASILPEKTEKPASVSSFDTAALTRLRGDFSQQLKSSGETFERTMQKWLSLADQFVDADSELDRLHKVETEYARVEKLYAGEKASTERLHTELRDVKGREAAANERAAKFEEICETIKERAFEIHTALQQSRTAEQKAQADLQAVQSELAELKRVAQDQAAERLVAEDRNTKLTAAIAKFEADDAAARDRLAKLAQDNKAMAAQVPQLLSDRDNWQKQFSASERENARMQAERKLASERIAELENEIKLLRTDLASQTSVRPEVVAAAAPAEEDEDSIDLVASLERAFLADEAEEAAKKAGAAN